MALLTVSKELPLTVSGEFRAYVKRSSWVSRECFTCARASTLQAFFAYKPSAEIRRLHSKRRMVIVSAEFGGKQIH